MRKLRSSMRQVPWQSWEHWNWVACELFSDSPQRAAAALNRVAAWQSRGKTPVAVEISAALIGIHQRDAELNPGIPLGSALPEDLLRMMYAMAIQRLVNGVVDQSRKHNTSSVADRAVVAGLPRLLVDIRHEAAHGELPGLSLLRLASKQALDWLKVQYWDKQRKTLMNARTQLKSKLLDHCLLVTEILNHGLAAGTEVQQSSNEQELDETNNKTGVVFEEALTVKQQRRDRLFNELLDLSLCSMSDLISIIVQDGLLELDALSSVGEPQGEERAKLDPRNKVDLRSVMDTAWKVTLRDLSMHLSQFSGMLLVAMIKHISKGCSQRAGTYCCTDEATPKHLQSRVSSHLAGERASLDFTRRDCLVSCCEWLLGKGSSERLSFTSSKERRKSLAMKVPTAVSIRVDLDKDLLTDLLRLCLRPSSGQEPLVELVPLIAGRLGGSRFQRRAVDLAKRGSCLWRVQSNIRSEPLDKQNPQVASTAVQEESIRDIQSPAPAVAGPTGECDKSDGLQSAKLPTIETARSQQEAFLAMQSSRMTSTRENSGSEGFLKSPQQAAPSTPGTSILTKDRNVPYSENSAQSRCGASVQPRWTLAENWKPCAIGMIPSPGHWNGILSSLELPGLGPRGDEAIVANREGGAACSIGQSFSAADATGVLESEGRRRKSDELEVCWNTSSAKRPKAGLHVHFEDSNRPSCGTESVADLSFRSPEGPSYPAHRREARHPEALENVHNTSSLLQGCILQQGMITPVALPQVEALQASVRVL